MTPTIAVFTDFDKCYLNCDKYSDVEDEPKYDKYFNYEETRILRSNHSTYDYKM